MPEYHRLGLEVMTDEFFDPKPTARRQKREIWEVEIFSHKKQIGESPPPFLKNEINQILNSSRVLFELKQNWTMNNTIVFQIWPSTASFRLVAIILTLSMELAQI